MSYPAEPSKGKVDNGVKRYILTIDSDGVILNREMEENPFPAEPIHYKINQYTDWVYVK